MLLCRSRVFLFLIFTYFFYIWLGIMSCFAIELFLSICLSFIFYLHSCYKLYPVFIVLISVMIEKFYFAICRWQGPKKTRQLLIIWACWRWAANCFLVLNSILKKKKDINYVNSLCAVWIFLVADYMYFGCSYGWLSKRMCYLSSFYFKLRENALSFK